MRSLLLSLLLASAAFAAKAADDKPVVGTWKVHINIAGNESDVACTFNQKDSELTGSCKGEQGPINITGKVEGKKVSWTYKIEYNGSPLTLIYGGNLDSDEKMSGTVKVDEFSVEGDFTATLSK
jgi:hypothetical protein